MQCVILSYRSCYQGGYCQPDQEKFNRDWRLEVCYFCIFIWLLVIWLLLRGVLWLMTCSLLLFRGVLWLMNCSLSFLIGALCIWWPVSCYLEGRSIFGDLFFAICRDVLCLHCDVVNFVGHQHWTFVKFVFFTGLLSWNGHGAWCYWLLMECLFFHRW